MDFPKSTSLPLLMSSDGWTWIPPEETGHFWVGKDSDGLRWLVKFRGGFNAARERAFSVIAQALGVSCQSSTFVQVSKEYLPSQLENTEEALQLAIQLIDIHVPAYCSEDCPLKELNRRFETSPYDINLLKSSPIKHAMDMARGEILGMLCEMHEPPGYLFTADHSFVQIDNELMFSRDAGGNLWKSPWVQYEGAINPDGLSDAIRLCERLLSLDESVFAEAFRLPSGHRPSVGWSLSAEITKIRPRALAFLETATGATRQFLL